jgi:hypothetical protein
VLVLVAGGLVVVVVAGREVVVVTGRDVVAAVVVAGREVVVAGREVVVAVPAETVVVLVVVVAAVAGLPGPNEKAIRAEVAVRAMNGAMPRRDRLSPM